MNKLNKRGDRRHPCLRPVPTLNQSVLQQMIIYFAEMTKFDLLVIDHYQPDNDNNSQGHLAYHSGLNPH